MSPSPGTSIGRFEVVGTLGAGGMGEVYRARDTKLNREVAVKILPGEFTLDVERVTRFNREAQLLASLNHPHIAAIYGIEESAAGVALVLELVEGPTLFDRLARGPVPVEEALRIARQLADALAAAHGQGIIHRDLKPGNIKLRTDGTVKVLDFGLAKGIEMVPAGADGASAATITSPALTEMGVALGTPAYMSPEQARGEVVDERTDIWAFGCVLFEMLAGARAFAGPSTPDTFAAVMRAEPEWGRLPHDTPESLRRTLRRCLEKDRDRRLADARDVRLEIEDAQLGASDPARRPGRSPWLERLVWSAALLSVAALAAAWRPGGVAPAPLFEMRAEIPTAATTDPVSFAISPDGRKLAFVASGGATPQLWLHSLEDGSVRPLRGTTGAAFPFWSPDSRALAFFANETLYRVDAEGGTPVPIAVAPVASGGTWSPAGDILFTPVPDASLIRVPAGGGDTTPVLTSTGPGGQGQRFPQFLPDGRHYLYYVRESRGVYLGNLGGQPARRLLEADAAAVFAAPGEILFVRDGRLLAQRLDLDRGELTGPLTPVAEGISVDWRGVAPVSASAVGTIAYRTGAVEHPRRLAWYDRTGKLLRTAADPDATLPVNPSLSPDGRTAAVSRSLEGNTDVWTLDVERRAFSRFTDAPGPDIVPIWSPDGTRIIYSKGMPQGVFRLQMKAMDGRGDERPLSMTIIRAIALDWSPDGRFVLFRTNSLGKGGWSVWAAPMNGDGEPFPVVQSNFNNRTAQFSWDGAWLAYESDESGRYEIYLHPFPGPGEKIRVSTGGGSKPRWSRGTGELFYVSADGELMAVRVRLPAGGRPELDRPVALFSTSVESTVEGGVAHGYAVAREGQQFLMSTLVEQPAAPVKLILNRAGSAH